MFVKFKFQIILFRFDSYLSFYAIHYLKREISNSETWKLSFVTFNRQDDDDADNHPASSGHIMMGVSKGAYRVLQHRTLDISSFVSGVIESFVINIRWLCLIIDIVRYWRFVAYTKWLTLSLTGGMNEWRNDCENWFPSKKNSRMKNRHAPI